MRLSKLMFLDIVISVVLYPPYTFFLSEKLSQKDEPQKPQNLKNMFRKLQPQMPEL